MRVNHVKTMTVEKEETVCRSIICDICKGRIASEKPYTKRPWIGRETVDFFRVKTGHNDWGNDSISSIEYKDVCKTCFDLGEAFKMYEDKLKECNTIYHTEYVEIEHIWVHDFGEFKDDEAKEVIDYA